MTSPRCYSARFGAASVLAIAATLSASAVQAQPANKDEIQKGYESTPESSHNAKLQGWVSLQSRSAYKGHVQKQGDRYIAYIGHHSFDQSGSGDDENAGLVMNPMTGKEEPNGTSIVDVTDPKNPVYLHHLPAHDGERQARNVNTCAGDDLPNGE